MAYSFVQYTSPGSQAEFQIPFPFLAVGHLTVSVNHVLKTRGIDYVVERSTNKLTFLEGKLPASGATVLIRRRTPRKTEERAVVFTDPSDLNAQTLNDSTLQLLFITQEVLDDIASGIGVGGQPGGPLIDGVTPQTQAALDDITAQNDATTATLQAAIADLQADVQAALTAANGVVSTISSIQSTANAAQAAVTTEAGARATADTALGARIDTVTASVGTVSADVTSEAVARATADTALGVRIDSVTASIGTTNANVTSEVAARVNADTALGTRIDTTNATLGSFQASTSSTLASLAAADAALSGRIDTVTAANEATSAAVTVEQTARVTAFNDVYARWAVQLDANGRVVGRIRLDGTAGTSTLDFTSDSLRVSHPSAPSVFFPTMNRSVGSTTSKVYTAASGFGFNHGNATILYGPAHSAAASNTSKIANVRNGAISVLIMSRIIGQAGNHCVYYRKNGTGSYVPLVAVTSADGAVVTAARNQYELSGIVASDYIEFFVAPCDGNGTISSNSASVRTELDVLAFNW